MLIDIEANTGEPGFATLECVRVSVDMSFGVTVVMTTVQLVTLAEWCNADRPDDMGTAVTLIFPDELEDEAWFTGASALWIESDTLTGRAEDIVSLAPVEGGWLAPGLAFSRHEGGE